MLIKSRKELHYSIFNTSWGWMGIIYSEKGIRKIFLPEPSYDSLCQIVESQIQSDQFDKNCTHVIIDKLVAYLNGEIISFDVPLDLPQATKFQQEVRQATCSIPYGETRTYSWISQHTDHPRAVRAIGQVLAHNPVPIIIPCHRVIAADGNLQGFRGGIEMKQRLINLEQNNIFKNIM